MRPEKSKLTPEQKAQLQRLEAFYSWKETRISPSETFKKLCMAAAAISELDADEEMLSKPEYANLQTYVIIGNSMKGCEQVVPHQK